MRKYKSSELRVGQYYKVGSEEWVRYLCKNEWGQYEFAETELREVYDCEADEYIEKLVDTGYIYLYNESELFFE